MSSLNGYLLVDKPLGWTSFDVVNKIRGTIQNSGLNTTSRKRFPVGHAGTLDPLATGLLIIMVGDYTKQAEAFSKLDKTYEVTARLGQVSTTGDEEGEKTKLNSSKPSLAAIEAVLEQFTGQIDQLPPQYSAIKINGQRAYKLARSGQTAELKPRPVTIYSITEVVYDYPALSFTVRVSSGTYIRSLVADIGEKLVVGAYTTALKRTSIDKYLLKDAQPMEELDAEGIYSSIDK